MEHCGWSQQMTNNNKSIEVGSNFWKIITLKFFGDFYMIAPVLILYSQPMA
jgi:hypothetical protein